MSKSDFLEQKVLDHVLINTAYASPVTVYVGLFTTVLQDDGSGTEVSGNAYARRPVTFSRAGSVCTNSAEATFAVATPGNWGLLVSFGVYDAATAGNLLYHGAISPTKTVNVGDAARFAIGQLSVIEN